MSWLTKLWRALKAYRKGVSVRVAYRVGNTVYMSPRDYAQLLLSTPGRKSAVALEASGVEIVPYAAVAPVWMVGKQAFMHVWRGHV